MSLEMGRSIEVPQPRRPEEGSVDARMREFLALAQYQADHTLPQNTDPYTDAYESVFAATLREDAEFRSIFAGLFDIDSHLEPKDQLAPEVLLKKTHKTFQYLESSLDPNFPQNHANPESWQNAMQRLLHDEDYRTRFDGNIVLPIMSNVSERGVLLKAAALLHGMSKNLSVLDLGCSLNDVLKRLACEDEPGLSFNEVAVMWGDPRRRGAPSPSPDRETTQRFNELLQSTPLELVDSIGMDAMPYEDDSRLRDRAVSDSRYMGELTLSRISEQFHTLAHIEHSGVGFMEADAATYNPLELGRKFKLTHQSAVHYQTPDQVSAAILDNADRSTEDDGLIVVQDFIRDFRRNGLPRCYKRWHDWTYSVWVKDKQRPDLKFQKYFTVYSGRVKAVIPQPALGRLETARDLGLVPRVES